MNNNGILSALVLGVGLAILMSGTGIGLLTQDVSERPDCRPPATSNSTPQYEFIHKKITIDGDSADWEGVQENVVEGPEYLWFGQGMTRELWHGNQDLSFRWRGAWYGDKLYFLIDVADDCVMDPPRQPCTYLNDCIEIYLDPLHLRGPRKEIVGGKLRLRGYETHFLPVAKPIMILDDVLSPNYPMDKPQNELFYKRWKGEMTVRRTSAGYRVEIAFSIPGVPLQTGRRMGLDVAVCDDDGRSRKALQIWSGNRGEFWLNMNGYPEVTLVEKYTAKEFG